MSLLTRLREHLEERRGPIVRRERPLWVATRSLNDVAELTAQWLEGRIGSQPGYYGPCDVDEGDAPGLTDTLIACNRVGFLTENSQAGSDGYGFDGARWQQLASVCGYAHPDTAHALADALHGTGFCVLVTEMATRRWNRDKGVVVTYREGDPHTTFGRQHDADHIDFAYDGCGPDAIADLRQSVQVTVYDPEPGRNILWAALRDVAGQFRGLR